MKSKLKNLLKYVSQSNELRNRNEININHKNGQLSFIIA